MISISRARDLDPRNQTIFDEVKPANIEDLSNFMLTQVWSPIVYKKGYRRAISFSYAQLVALDFDNDGSGPEITIEDTKHWCDTMGVSYIIGTTKSHQKEKTTLAGVVRPPVDRYRLVFIAKDKCENRTAYEYNMAEAVTIFGSDRSGKDGARFFFPCKEIVAIGRGVKWEWQTPPISHLSNEQRLEKTFRIASLDAQQGVVPLWVIAILNGHTVIEPGQRHTTCYKLGYHLALRGWSLEKIIGKITQTRLKEIGIPDVERAITNGYDRAYLDLRTHTETRAWPS